MSGVLITQKLLLADAAVLALTPGTKIFLGVVPQGTLLPAIGITEVSSTDRQTLAGSPVVKVTERVQITVLAATYKIQKDVIARVRHACRAKVGTVGEPPGTVFQGVTCRLDGKGPDFNDPASNFFMQTQDTLVTFNEVA